MVAAALVLTGCTGGPSTPSAAPTGTRLDTTLEGLAATAPAYTQLRAVLVMRDGATVFEGYFASSSSDYRSVYSVTKSVVSALVGIAVADGDLALDDTLGELLPGYRTAMDPATARVTLKQLLTMSGGFDDTWAGSADFGRANWARAALRHHRGEVGDFAYSDYGAHLVAVVLAEATGRDLLDYARERLFDPIGISTRPGLEPLAVPENADAYARAGFAWPVDPQGVNLGEALLRLTPRDMLAFGKLYLNGGRAGARQVVPAGWVRDSTTRQVPATGGSNGYGYLWWSATDDGKPAFRAIGWGGQLIEVVPSRKLVVVVASDADPLDVTDYGVARSSVRLLVDDFILPRYR